MTYISLLIIPCIIYHVTNKETLTLTLTLTNIVKVRGDNTRPNGRTQYWYALPQKRTSGTFCDSEECVLEIYRDKPGPLDLICGMICFKVNILNLNCMTESFRTRRSKNWPQYPILLLNYEIPAGSLVFPDGVGGRYSIGPFLLTEACTSCSITRTCWGWPPWWKTHP